MECSIVGVTARFSGKKSIPDFWQALVNGESLISEISQSRFELMNRDSPVPWGPRQLIHGMYLDDIDTFDRQVFPLSGPAIMFADPRQRMLLESCWKAIEDAGLDASTLSGRKVGVFIAQDGWFLGSYVDRIPEEHRDNQEFIVPGNDPCFLANRISFFFNFVGPSKVIDTTCSSAYVALDEACQALTSGECDYALVGGVSLFLNPWKKGETTATPFETQSDEVNSFAEQADGYRTSEGCAAILLTRSSTETEKAHHVYGVVKATGHNIGGKTNSFAQPNQQQQARLFRELIQRAQLSAAQIQYVEAHGVASPMGDATEANALLDVFTGSRKEGEAPCYVSTMKPNIGHNHASSGLYAILKVLLAFQHNQIPGIRSLAKAGLNHEIPTTGRDLKFVSETTAWSGAKNGSPGRYALLTSYGFSSVNAAVILQEPNSEAEHAALPDPAKEIICLSAQTETQLFEVARALLAELENPRFGSPPLLRDVAWTLCAGRKAFSWRWAAIVDSLSSLKNSLQALTEEPEQSIPNVFRGKKEPGTVTDLLSADPSQLHALAEQAVCSAEFGQVARLWAAGVDIDWESCRQTSVRKRIPLPTYPFARERYWLPRGSQPLQHSSGSAAWLHPFVHANTSDFSEHRFSTLFNGNEFCLSGHVIHGIKVLPGVGHLELARAASHQCYRTHKRNPATDTIAKGLVLQNVVWANIIGVTGAPKEVHIRFIPDGLGGAEYQLYSQDGTEVVHNSGSVLHRPLGKPATYDIPAMQQKLAAHEYSPKSYYDMYLALGLYMAPDYQGIERLFVGADHVLAKLSLPASLEDTRAQFVLHPCLMDGALLSSVGLLMSFSDLTRPIPPKCLIPFGLDEIEFYDEVSTIHWAWISYSEGCSAHDPFPKVDVECCDSDGKVCIRFKGFSCRGFGDQSSQSTDIQPYILQPGWKTQVFPDALPKYHADERIVFYSAACASATELPERSANVLLVAIPGFADTTVSKSSLSVIEAELAPLFADPTDRKVLVQLIVPIEAVTAECAGVMGVLKAQYRHDPRFIGQLIEIDPLTIPVENLVQEGMITQHERVRLDGVHRSVSTWLPLQCAEVPLSADQSPWHNQGVYLILDNQGGIADWLTREILSKANNATCLAVSLHSGRAVEICRYKQNAFEKRDIFLQPEQLMQDLVAYATDHFGPLNGIFYCHGKEERTKNAGQLFDPMLQVLTDLRQLDACTRTQLLDFFCVVTGRDGVLGSSASIEYAAALAAASRFVDERTAAVSEYGQGGQSLALILPWTEVSDEDTFVSRMIQQTLYQAFSEGSCGQLMLMEGGEIERFRLDLLGVRTCYDACAEFADPVAGPAVACPVVSAGTENTSVLRYDLEQQAIQIVKSVVCPAVGLPAEEVGLDAALDVFGIDSVSSIKMTEQLEKRFGRLPKTLFFEYLTIRELAGFFVSKHAEKLLSVRPQSPAPEAVAPQSVTVASQSTSEAAHTADSSGSIAEDQLIAIVGLAGRFPKARNMDEFWQILAAGKDCITEIPAERWDNTRYFDLDKTRKGTTYSRWGGFIDGVDEFDPLFFNLSPKDARAMSPQERVFVQCAYEVMEDAGYAHKQLSGRNLTQISDKVGVFVGVMYGEYEFYSVEAIAAGQVLDQSIVTGSFGSIANRVSHYFNFSGPSLALDTMCSSSLTAIHQACRSIQAGDCEAAIAGGVNLTLHPNKYLILSQSQFLSDNGKCLSFGAGGSGYVPAEGVGAVLLKPLSKAKQDGDQIYAVIRGSAVNHGGKTNGYTVPNPAAQAAAIEAAIEAAGLPAGAVSYIEAHGTGTSLGDPIEIAGLEKAFARFDKSGASCAVGSVKSNIGHCESAAGIAGLAKVLLQMKHRKLVPSIHSENLNPNIDFESSRFFVPQHFSDWQPLSYPNRVAGISSFGAGGGNAHIIVEEFVAEPEQAGQDDGAELVLIPLSARTAERLTLVAERLLKHLSVQVRQFKDCPQRYLRRVARTLQLGREEMEHRAIFLVADIKTLLVQLAAFAERSKVPDPYWKGRATSQKLSSTAPAFSLVSTRDSAEYSSTLAQMAIHWVEGGLLDWNIFYQHLDTKPARLSLPTYPFARELYWVPAAVPAEQRPAQVFTAAQLDATASEPLDDLCYFTGEWVSQPCVQLSAEREASRVELIVIGQPGEIDIEPFRAMPEVSAVHCWPMTNPNAAFYTSLVVRLVQYCQTWAKALPKSRTELLVLVPWQSYGIPLQGLMGALRTIQMEFPLLQTRLVLHEELTKQRASSVCSDLQAEISSVHAAVGVWYRRDGHRLVWRARVLDIAASNTLPCVLDTKMDVVWIVGGLGGLGLQLAKLISERTGATIVISGRTRLDQDVQCKLDELLRQNIPVKYLQSDINSRAEIENAASLIRRSYGKLNGIVHCAGVLADKLIVNKSEEDLLPVLSVKVNATVMLDEVTKDDPLAFFLLCSSLASWGNVGQVDYAAANAFLDSFASFRNESLALGQRRGRCVAVNWPLLADGGMTVSAEVEQQMFRRFGIRPLPKQLTLAALELALSLPYAQFGVMYGNKASILRYLQAGEPADTQAPMAAERNGFATDIVSTIVSKLLGMDSSVLDTTRSFADYGMNSIDLSELADKLNTALLQSFSQASFLELDCVDKIVASMDLQQQFDQTEHCQADIPSRSELKSQDMMPSEPRLKTSGTTHKVVLQKLAELLGMDADRIDPERSFGHYGMDSVGLTELSQHLNEQLNTQTSSATFLELDCAAKLIEFLDENAGQQEPKCTVPDNEADTDYPRFAIVGYDCTFPGADNALQYWQNLTDEIVSIRQLSSEEWHSRGIQAIPGEESVAARMKYSGYLHDIENFDAEFWGIDDEVARQMDPQQRLLMRSIWRCIENAGYSAAEITAQKVGLFVAVDSAEYKSLIRNSGTVGGLQAGLSLGMMINQVSHYFDFRGPSEITDNACASVFVGVQRAQQALQNGECDIAIVAGVKVILDFMEFYFRDRGGILSQSGIMAPFDQRADGYIRGEGVGSIVLKPLSAALKASDHVHAVVRSVSVSHNGRNPFSSMAPSVEGQSKTLQTAYQQAGIDPGSIDYIEAHGSATQFNDASEVVAFKRLFKHSEHEHKCAVSSVKGNIGHLEAASGIASVIKVILAMRFGAIPPIASFTTLPKSIRLDNSPLYFPTSLVPWKKGASAVLRAGLNSIGISGVNAHLILESIDSPIPIEEKGGYKLVVISAKSEEALHRYWQSWSDMLEGLNNSSEYANMTLQNLAYSSQVGREAMRYRSGFVVKDILQLAELLRAMLAGDSTESEFALSVAGQAEVCTRDVVFTPEFSTNFENLKDLARKWVAGSDFDWRTFAVGSGRYVHIPNYPFIEKRHWLAGKKTAMTENK